MLYMLGSFAKKNNIWILFYGKRNAMGRLSKNQKFAGNALKNKKKFRE